MSYEALAYIALIPITAVVSFLFGAWVGVSFRDEEEVEAKRQMTLEDLARESQR